MKGSIFLIESNALKVFWTSTFWQQQQKPAINSPKITILRGVYIFSSSKLYRENCKCVLGCTQCIKTVHYSHQIFYKNVWFLNDLKHWHKCIFWLLSLVSLRVNMLLPTEVHLNHLLCPPVDWSPGGTQPRHLQGTATKQQKVWLQKILDRLSRW